MYGRKTCRAPCISGARPHAFVHALVCQSIFSIDYTAILVVLLLLLSSWPRENDINKNTVCAHLISDYGRKRARAVVYRPIPLSRGRYALPDRWWSRRDRGVLVSRRVRHGVERETTNVRLAVARVTVGLSNETPVPLRMVRVRNTGRCKADLFFFFFDVTRTACPLC